MKTNLKCVSCVDAACHYVLDASIAWPLCGQGDKLWPYTAQATRACRCFVTLPSLISHHPLSLHSYLDLPHPLHLNTSEHQRPPASLLVRKLPDSIMKSLLLLLPLVAASPLTVGTIHNDAAPLLSSSNAKEIPNSYVVVFKKHVTHETASQHHSWVQDLHYTTQNTKTELRKRDQFPLQDTVFDGLRHTYNIAGNLLGYSGHFDDDVIEQVRRDPDVGLCCQSIGQKLTCPLSRSNSSSVTRRCTP